MKRIENFATYLKQKNKFFYEIGRVVYILFKVLEQSFWKLFGKVKINTFYLEPTSICNLNCKFCTLDDSRKKGFLKKETLIKILEDIKNNKILVKEFSLHLGGESFLHPDFTEFLKIIAKYKKQVKHFPKVDALTNCMLLKKELSKKILETDCLDMMRFSIDHGNKKKYEQARVGANWETVLKNVNDFLDLNKSLNKNIETNIFTILTGDDKKNYSPEFLKLTKRVTKYLPRKLHAFIGDVDLGLQFKPRNWLCHFIIKDFAVFWDGRVTACCADLNGKIIIGDLNNQSIKQIFFGKKRMNMIKTMFFRGRKKIPYCSNCSL